MLSEKICTFSFQKLNCSFSLLTVVCYFLHPSLFSLIAKFLQTSVTGIQYPNDVNFPHFSTVITFYIKNVVSVITVWARLVSHAGCFSFKSDFLFLKLINFLGNCRICRVWPQRIFLFLPFFLWLGIFMMRKSLFYVFIYLAENCGTPLVEITSVNAIISISLASFCFSGFCCLSFSPSNV